MGRTWLAVVILGFVTAAESFSPHLASLSSTNAARHRRLRGSMLHMGTDTEAMKARLREVLLEGQAKDPEPSWDLVMSSPSKINLFLRITARRDDGYHDLASLFQAIALSDTLKMSKLPADAEDDIFECDMAEVPLDRSNLVLRAIDRFREMTGIKQFFHVRLEKTVPAQAGLGGGSGNAATALYASNELCGRPATPAELEEWSKVLGSDATFFMSQGTAYCTGRGEILTPLPALPITDLYIVKPDVGLSTPSVFKALDLDTRSTADPRSLLDLHTKQESGPDKFVNDLEPPAFTCLPDLKALKERLVGFGFDVVSMSGSGTSLFCMGEPDPAKIANWPADLVGDSSLPWPVRVFKTEFINRPADEWYPATEG